MTDVLIIGAGPAGLSAAIYAARAGVSVLVLEKSIYGGQISQTSELDNYPTRQGVDGATFANDLYEHATAQGAQVLFEEVVTVEFGAQIKTATTDQAVHKARTVILALGAAHRKLGCPGEEKFAGRGVSYCATCDGAFFREKVVAIVGGGDTALGEALFLSNICKKVYLIHRRDSFRAQKASQDAIASRKNIELMMSSAIENIEGDAKVASCVVKTPNGNKVLDVDGIFVAVGQNPQTQLFKDILALNEGGYIDAQEDCKTNIPGIFVAGDLRKKPLRQVVTAVCDGAVAAVAAAEYCNSQIG